MSNILASILGLRPPHVTFIKNHSNLDTIFSTPNNMFIMYKARRSPPPLVPRRHRLLPDSSTDDGNVRPLVSLPWHAGVNPGVNSDSGVNSRPAISISILKSYLATPPLLSLPSPLTSCQHAASTPDRHASILHYLRPPHPASPAPP